MSDSSDIATIIHISDLHFTAIGPNGRPILEPVSTKLWSITPFFDGLLGHETFALRALELFVKQRKLSGALVVTTGDLTAAGRREHYTLATEYLETNNEKTGYKCLGIRDWARLAIPGNHDQWPGTDEDRFLGVPQITGTENPMLKRTFRELPFVESRDLNGCTLTFIGINTDVDCSNTERRLARGSFRTDLDALTEKLWPKNDSEIRILLLHHSYGYEGIYLNIEDNSKKALGDFVPRFGIDVMLSGHTHVPLLQELKMNGSNQTVLEACCGSTTQAPRVPYAYEGLLGGMPNRKASPRALFVHRVFRERNRVKWEAHCYSLRNNGFVPMEKDPEGKYYRVVTLLPPSSRTRPARASAVG